MRRGWKACQGQTLYTVKKFLFLILFPGKENKEDRSSKEEQLSTVSGNFPFKICVL
jgi:hypothetical protein